MQMPPPDQGISFFFGKKF